MVTSDADFNVHAVHLDSLVQQLHSSDALLGSYYAIYNTVCKRAGLYDALSRLVVDNDAVLAIESRMSECDLDYNVFAHHSKHALLPASIAYFLPGVYVSGDIIDVRGIASLLSQENQMCRVDVEKGLSKLEYLGAIQWVMASKGYKMNNIDVTYAYMLEEEVEMQYAHFGAETLRMPIVPSALAPTSMTDAIPPAWVLDVAVPNTILGERSSLVAIDLQIPIGEITVTECTNMRTQWCPLYPADRNKLNNNAAMAKNKRARPARFTFRSGPRLVGNFHESYDSAMAKTNLAGEWWRMTGMVTVGRQRALGTDNTVQVAGYMHLFGDSYVWDANVFTQNAKTWATNITNPRSMFLYGTRNTVSRVGISDPIPRSTVSSGRRRANDNINASLRLSLQRVERTLSAVLGFMCNDLRYHQVCMPEVPGKRIAELDSIGVSDGDVAAAMEGQNRAVSVGKALEDVFGLTNFSLNAPDSIAARGAASQVLKPINVTIASVAEGGEVKG